MLQYYARRFFNQTLLSPVVENDRVRVYYVDDHLVLPQKQEDDFSNENKERQYRYNKLDDSVVEEEEDTVLRFKPFSKPFGLADRTGVRNSLPAMLKMYVQVYSFSQVSGPVKTMQVEFPKPVEPSTIILDETVDSILSNTKPFQCTRETCFIFVTLDPNSDEAPSNVLLLSNFKSVALKGLKPAFVEIVAVTKIDNLRYGVDLKSDAVAPFVWLEARGVPGWFSDNGFMMMHDRKMLVFNAWEDVEVETVRASMRVRSLMDMY